MSLPWYHGSERCIPMIICDSPEGAAFVFQSASQEQQPFRVKQCPKLPPWIEFWEFHSSWEGMWFNNLQTGHKVLIDHHTNLLFLVFYGCHFISFHLSSISKSFLEQLHTPERVLISPNVVQTLLADSIWDSAKSWRKKAANSTNGCFPNCLAESCPLKLQKNIVNRHEIGDLSWTWSWKTEGTWQSVPCSPLATLCIHDLWLCHQRPPFWGFPIAMAAMFHSKRARVYFNKPFSRATNSSMPSLKGKHVLLQIAVPNTEVLYFPNTREKKHWKHVLQLLWILFSETIRTGEWSTY